MGEIISEWWATSSGICKDDGESTPLSIKDAASLVYAACSESNLYKHVSGTKGELAPAIALHLFDDLMSDVYIDGELVSSCPQCPTTPIVWQPGATPMQQWPSPKELGESEASFLTLPSDTEARYTCPLSKRQTGS